MLRASFFALLGILLSACTVGQHLAQNLAEEVLPDTTELMISPHERYLALLSRIAPGSGYYGFTGFSIVDTRTGQVQHQTLGDVPTPYGGLSGIVFTWTPSQNYIVIVADMLASSHGCDEMFVYSGDGSALVFNTGTTTSLCRSIFADTGLSITQLCPNDDIIYSGYRLTPSTGVYVSQNPDEPYCPDDE